MITHCEGGSADRNPEDPGEEKPEKGLLENSRAEGKGEARSDQDEYVGQGGDMKRAAKSGEEGEGDHREVPPPFEPFPRWAHSEAEVAEILPMRFRLTSPVERSKRSAQASTRKGTTECWCRTSPTASRLLLVGMS